MIRAYSAIIPLYNKERHIIRALESAVAALKSFKHEVIVVDDGSTDQGAFAVENFADSHPELPIKLFRQPNRGVSVARNVGIDRALYGYVLLLDADDQWREGFVKVIDDLVRSYPDAGMFATAYADVWHGNEPVVPKYYGVPAYSSGGILNRYFLSRAKGAEPVCASAVCLKKTVCKRAGGFPEEFTHGEDKIFWARIALKEKIAWSEEIGANRYRYGDNRSDKELTPDRAHHYVDELKQLLDSSDCMELTKNDIRKDMAKGLELYAKLLVVSRQRIKALKIAFRIMPYISVFRSIDLFVRLLIPRRILFQLRKVKAYVR